MKKYNFKIFLNKIDIDYLLFFPGRNLNFQKNDEQFQIGPNWSNLSLEFLIG